MITVTAYLLAIWLSIAQTHTEAPCITQDAQLQARLERIEANLETILCELDAHCLVLGTES